MSTVREAQVEYALGTRERQAQRTERMLNLLEDQPNHHGYAVVVKVHGLWCECEPEQVTHYECACGYHQARALFWEDASEVAKKHGFHGVWQDGRSGGYAVPHPQPKTDDMYEHEVEEWARDTFGPFAVELLEVLDAAKDDVGFNV